MSLVHTPPPPPVPPPHKHFLLTWTSFTLHFCIYNYCFSVLHCSNHQRRRFTLVPMKETSQSLLSFSLETVYPPLFLPTLQMGKNSVPLTLFSHLTDGEKQCTPSLFLPTLQMGKNSVPLTLFPHLTDGEKE